ncbi:MAG: hypothetical protein Q9218_006538 [Villophora microphyllina]
MTTVSLPKTVKELLEKHTIWANNNDKDNPDCYICHDPYRWHPNNELPLKLPGCGHIFGTNCIADWLYGGPDNKTCPLCRAPIIAAPRMITDEDWTEFEDLIWSATLANWELPRNGAPFRLSSLRRSEQSWWQLCEAIVSLIEAPVDTAKAWLRNARYYDLVCICSFDSFAYAMDERPDGLAMRLVDELRQALPDATVLERVVSRVRLRRLQGDETANPLEEGEWNARIADWNLRVTRSRDSLFGRLYPGRTMGGRVESDTVRPTTVAIQPMRRRPTVSVNQDPTKTLRAPSVFYLAINFIFIQSQAPWDGVERLHYPFNMPGHRHNVAIFAQALPGPYTMTNALMFYALWDGVVAMSEWNRYEASAIDVIYSGRVCGQVFITRFRELSGNATTAMGDGVVGGRGNNMTAIEGVDISSSNSSSNVVDGDDEDSGVFTMVQHPGAFVPYDFEGPRIAANDVFTAIIEALIIIVHDGAMTPLTRITAVSASARCVVELWEAEKDAAVGVMAGVLLHMLTELIMHTKRFQTMTFALEQEVGQPGVKQRLVKGHLLCLNPSVTRNVTTA